VKARSRLFRSGQVKKRSVQVMSFHVRSISVLGRSSQDKVRVCQVRLDQVMVRFQQVRSSQASSRSG